MAVRKTHKINMKTYVLIVSQRFPQTHPRKGEPTMFIENILDEKKIHTIRGNFPLWKKRMDGVQNGLAEISIRVWTGKPYRSPQEEILRIGKEFGCGVQRLVTAPYGCWIDNTHNHKQSHELFAENDGLTEEDFFEWFRGVKNNTEMVIIHFSKFRY